MNRRNFIYTLTVGLVASPLIGKAKFLMPDKSTCELHEDYSIIIPSDHLLEKNGLARCKQIVFKDSTGTERIVKTWRLRLIWHEPYKTVISREEYVDIMLQESKRMGLVGVYNFTVYDARGKNGLVMPDVKYGAWAMVRGTKVL